MATPSPGYSMILRVEAPAGLTVTSELASAAARAGAAEFDQHAPWMEARIADLPEPEVPPGVTVEEVVEKTGAKLEVADDVPTMSLPATV